jgi:hypothetical protein
MTPLLYRRRKELLCRSNAAYHEHRVETSHFAGAPSLDLLPEFCREMAELGEGPLNET